MSAPNQNIDVQDTPPADIDSGSDSSESDNDDIVLDELELLGNAFVNSEGSTFKNTKSGPKKVFNFTLKKCGTVYSDREEGKWMFLLRTLTDESLYEERKIMLDSQSFLGKMQFISKITCQCPNLFLIVQSSVNPPMLILYLEWLQNQYMQNEHARTYRSASFIGYHPRGNTGTWVLSNEVQIQGNHLLTELEREFMLKDQQISASSLTVNKELFDKSYLRNVTSQVINFSRAFGVNNLKFLQALSFGAMRMLKASYDEASAAEARYCFLYSKTKSLGKTSSLEIIAHGQGVQDTHDHKFVIGGGDGGRTGMSDKMQQKVFSETNLVVFVNEIVMSQTIAGTLNQAHDRMAAGSMGAGLTTARSSIMGSSNTKEHEMLDGRMLRITYNEGCYSDEMHHMLTAELYPLAKNNPGFLLLWCCHYRDFIRRGELRYKHRMHSLVLKQVKHQGRYTRALGINILYLFMFHISSNVVLDCVSAFKDLVCQNEELETNVVLRLGGNLIQNIQQSSEVFTWCNPDVTFTDENKIHHSAYAIQKKMLETFSDVQYQEIADLLKPFGKKCIRVNAYFAKEADSTKQDLSKKEKVATAKSVKVPWSLFPKDVKDAIDAAIESKAIHQASSNSSNKVEVASIICKEDRNELKRIYKGIADDFKLYNGATPQESCDPLLLLLPPGGKRTYDQMTPEYKAAFLLGRKSVLS